MLKAYENIHSTLNQVVTFNPRDTDNMESWSIEHLQYFLEEHWASFKFILAVISVLISLFLVTKWLEGGWCYSTVQLTGKTVIVTGANTGIGKECARDFYRRGAKVILACRDLDKAAAAAREIESIPSVDGRVLVRHLDLASFTTIHAFAKDILETESSIDILVNNAGLMSRKKITDDGFDLVFGTNHLGHFLLTNLLLDKITDSAPARIVNVSSIGHQYGCMHWNDLNLNETDAYDPWKAYCQSKLANILFTKELARRLKGTGVTVYATHPGAVKTDFGRNLPEFCPKILRIVIAIVGPLYAKTALQGAQTVIYCAVSENVTNQTGLYYSDCGETKPSSLAMNEDHAKKLWNMSAAMVKLDDALGDLDSVIKNK